MNTATRTRPNHVPAAPATALQRLYAGRFVFAILWALVTATVASDLGPVPVSLLVLYPLVDVAATLADARCTGPAGSRTVLQLNVALSALAALGIAAACASGVPAVLRVWGAWAIVSGAAQAVVALRRRRTMAGQLPMLVSGTISVFAGVAFVVMASGDDPSLGGAVGYAVPGGIFFLLSALRLRAEAHRLNR